LQKVSQDVQVHWEHFEHGTAEEAPGACKDVTAVVNATEHAGLARIVARLSPLICIKGQGLPDLWPQA
jgi:RNA-splicing ligase RtcB